MPHVYRPNPPVRQQRTLGAAIASVPPVQRLSAALKGGVAQRMEMLGKFVSGVKAVGMAITHTKPNPFEMETFTSCICFVFNVAGKTVEEFTEGVLYKHIFDSIKSTWESRKTKGAFYALCPYEEDGGFTAEWKALYSKSDFGDRPLVVVIGHCSPGGSAIQNDAHDKSYDIPAVINAITPTLRNTCTIYLTPCNTGIPSTTSASFQDQFTTELSTNTHPSLDYFTIGTTSKSVPLFGKVWTAEQTYTHQQQPISQEQYVKSQN